MLFTAFLILGFMKFHEMWLDRTRFILHKHVVSHSSRACSFIKKQLLCTRDAFNKNSVIRGQNGVPCNHISHRIIISYVLKWWDYLIAYTTEKNKDDHHIHACAVLCGRLYFIDNYDDDKFFISTYWVIVRKVISWNFMKTQNYVLHIRNL